MNIILQLFRALIGNDLDVILAQFHRVDAQLETYLAAVSERKYQISRERSDLLNLIQNLDDEDVALLDQADRATRVRTKIQDIVA